MDYIVRLFRSLANTTRQAILHFVVHNPGSPVSVIATKLELPRPDVSKALRILSDQGIVDKRPAGTYVLATLGEAESARHHVLRHVRMALAKVFAADHVSAAAEVVCPEHEEPTWPELYEMMCFDFTAYTHLRRLLMLRYLDGHQGRDLAQMSREIGMSHMAGWRHTDKLLRRGLLHESRDGRRGVLAIQHPPSTWLRAELLNCVLASLRGDAD